MVSELALQTVTITIARTTSYTRARHSSTVSCGLMSQHARHIIYQHSSKLYQL